MTISYSMCWEDPLILLESLKVSNTDNVLSVISGGENFFALLLQNPKKLVGIDINKEQIFLTKLKMCAIENLGFKDFVKFIGLTKSRSRIQTFGKIKKYLNKEEKLYWENNLNFVDSGIIHCGKFERYLSKFRRYCLPLIMSKKKINKFLLLNSLSKQNLFYDTYWNSKRFRFLFRLFFSKKGLESGREKKYFKHSSRLDTSGHYLERVRYGLTEVPIKSNFFMQYILTGTISAPFNDHPYLDGNNFEILKKLIKREKFKIIHSDIEKFLKKTKDKSFSKYNLSDVFEAKSQKEYNEILKKIKRVSKKGSILCYWNNLVSRYNHPQIRGITLDKKISQELFEKDRVHFYSKFIVEKIN